MAEGSYAAASLVDEGFMHCSRPEQTARVANAGVAGQRDLVLLCIDEERVVADVRYEGWSDDGPRFPHVYGDLNLDAVLEVVDFPPGEDGTFELPTRISELQGE